MVEVVVISAHVDLSIFLRLACTRRDCEALGISGVAVVAAAFLPLQIPYYVLD